MLFKQLHFEFEISMTSVILRHGIIQGRRLKQLSRHNNRERIMSLIWWSAKLCTWFRSYVRLETMFAMRPAHYIHVLWINSQANTCTRTSFNRLILYLSVLLWPLKQCSVHLTISAHKARTCYRSCTSCLLYKYLGIYQIEVDKSKLSWRLVRFET